MLRYALDNLGWFEFEGLIQTLLKARLGLGVEAWGRRGDEGRDAYFEGVLAYPAPSEQSGVFIFQAKFVDGANAAGATSESAVAGAVSKECIRIQERIKHGAWKVLPSHYALFTNAPLGPSARIKIRERINEVLPGCSVHVDDGNDVCAWLDLTDGFGGLRRKKRTNEAVEILGGAGRLTRDPPPGCQRDWV